MTDVAALREAMVERQIAGRGIKDARLLAAMRAVPREMFVPEAARALAYEDGPLPIEAGQTISQPYIVALMIEAAGVAPGSRVLEIGAGSGYAAAILSRIAAEVVAIERHAALADLAAARMDRLGYANVRIETGDGSAGWPAAAPYDAILVAASGSHVPEALVRQLRTGGTLVMPVGPPGGAQNLVRITRLGGADWKQEELAPVRFVPLIGVQGWSE
jgi:protein-L-isoaspartate(D-aspartate) O-methyltransferase